MPKQKKLFGEEQEPKLKLKKSKPRVIIATIEDNEDTLLKKTFNSDLSGITSLTAIDKDGKVIKPSKKQKQKSKPKQKTVKKKKPKSKKTKESQVQLVIKVQN